MPKPSDSPSPPNFDHPLPFPSFSHVPPSLNCHSDLLEMSTVSASVTAFGMLPLVRFRRGREAGSESFSIVSIVRHGVDLPSGNPKIRLTKSLHSTICYKQQWWHSELRNQEQPSTQSKGIVLSLHGYVSEVEVMQVTETLSSMMT